MFSCIFRDLGICHRLCDPELDFALGQWYCGSFALQPFGLTLVIKMTTSHLFWFWGINFLKMTRTITFSIPSRVDSPDWKTRFSYRYWPEGIFRIFFRPDSGPPGYVCFYREKGKFIGTGHFFPHCMAFLEKGGVSFPCQSCNWKALCLQLHLGIPRRMNLAKITYNLREPVHLGHFVGNPREP